MKFSTLSARMLLGTAFAVALALAQSQSSGNAAGSGADHANHGASNGSGSAMVGKSDQDFVMKAAKGGMTEVQLAQMAQQKASSQEVKDYARRLEQDHTKANDQLKSIAQERQIQMPSDSGPEHQQMASRLNNMSGEEFDRAYIRMMIQDHHKDIKEFERESTRSMDSSLKEFATSTLPTLREHLNMAEQISGSTRSRKGSSVNSSSTNSNSSTSSNTK